ncbi:chloride channel protein CLC-e isoform X3 [Brachypodium distachyon]|uniref:chloride channel protein CLC-e isoform X3 n=1 Tax=Brachypodium distachyon TaxID=15368 RepID=UPI000D0CE599|nr:chloride channel protein CLC-e isoform X3 [Brachypodium distachyon]|eukprot:XP_024314893.1 chloride channel protein CLC-e isoform X3 [Brachypodium distachyon]
MRSGGRGDRRSEGGAGEGVGGGDGARTRPRHARRLPRRPPHWRLRRPLQPVHEIRDLLWDGIPLRGASWLREEPTGEIWQRVIFVPVSGGIIVGGLNALRNSIKSNSDGTVSRIMGVFRPFLKAAAASFTLGTGNSLGPEGPSVEIGSAIAKGFGNVFRWEDGKTMSLVAAGSAAGIASGFNAAVAGCFFAVESVLWPSSVNSSSLSNSTPMVILSAVIASVVSEIGLGSDPAFTVPEYDFRSPTELPLYLLLGVFCGLVSITLSRCTALTMDIVENLQKTAGLPMAASPALGGLIVGLLALIYPEVLYWGFENVDILLESRPFTSGLSATVLVQLIGVKILATSLCRAFGLVGGYYAPSLFIGAATGMAYGKFMRFTFTGPESLFHVPFLDVASPQAYGLVGMAATLAGVCKVPLTSVLLLFELTQDYRIVLPLLGAVGLSSWIASPQRFSKSSKGKLDSLEEKTSTVQQTKSVPSQTQQVNSLDSVDATAELCKLESSLCLYNVRDENILENLTVAEAMKTRYISVSLTTPIIEALNLMFVEKQPFVVIIESNKSLVGLLTLKDFQDFCGTVKITKAQTEVHEHLVSHVCGVIKCKMCSVTPQMPLATAEKIMDSHGVDQLPVISANHQDGGPLIGFIDRECITIARRASAAKDFFKFQI